MVSLTFGQLNQSHVACMQRTHRGNQREALPVIPYQFGALPQCLKVTDDLHGPDCSDKGARALH
jgi:hypothetical protein